jgi:hypothetical protein
MTDRIPFNLPVVEDPNMPANALALVGQHNVVLYDGATVHDLPRCGTCGAVLTTGAWPFCPHQPVQPTRFLWNKVK